MSFGFWNILAFSINEEKCETGIEKIPTVNVIGTECIYMFIVIFYYALNCFQQSLNFN